MRRLFATLIAAFALAWTPGAAAKVTISFQSFNGSALVGRYPHTFIVLRGTDDATGRTVDENYGFTARRVTPAVLTGPVEHEVSVEKPKYITTTNRHFSIELSQAQFDAIEREVVAWRDHPGRYYDLNRRNCIHFVGRMAELAGLKVDYPKELLRKPRAWLNRIGRLNPQIASRQF